MNELKVFQNSEFGELGVMTIDGKEYFPAIQCAQILGYSNPRKASKVYVTSTGEKMILSGILRECMNNIINLDLRQRRAKVSVTLHATHFTGKIFKSCPCKNPQGK